MNRPRLLAEEDDDGAEFRSLKSQLARIDDAYRRTLAAARTCQADLQQAETDRKQLVTNAAVWMAG